MRDNWRRGGVAARRAASPLDPLRRNRKKTVRHRRIDRSYGEHASGLGLLLLDMTLLGTLLLVSQNKGMLFECSINLSYYCSNLNVDPIYHDLYRIDLEIGLN